MAQKIDHKFWEKYFKVYDVLNYVIPYQELLDTIVEKLEIKEGDLVLDAGCGTGNLVIKMKEKGARVIGLDNCIEALDRYRKKCPDAEIVVSNLTDKLPFSDNIFDKIAANNVIYTLDKQIRLKLFRELYRVLKPTGILVVSDAHIGFKPVKIYFDTIKIQKERTGFFKTIKLILKVAIPTVKMLIYNKQLVSESEKGSLDFIEPQEHIELMRACGFKEISDNLNVYSDQATLNKCRKL